MANNSPRTAVLTTILATLLLLGSAGPAAAGATTIKDPRDNVWVYDWLDDNLRQTSWSPDISRVHVVHTSKRLTVTTWFWKLPRHDQWEWLAAFVNVDADPQPEYRMEWNSDLGGAVYRGRIGFRKTCGTIYYRVFPKLKRAVLAADQTCFGPRARVSVGVEHYDSWDYNYSGDPYYDYAYEDTAFTPFVDAH